MGIASYDDLTENMAFWLKRQDLTALIPTFIELAEEYFDKTVYVIARRATYRATPTQSVFPVPSDCKQPILAYWGGKELDYYPLGFNSHYAQNPSSPIQHGYQIIGNNVSLSVPQLGAVFQLDYFTTLEPLSPSNESNWLLEDAPSIYLYGALYQGATYMRDDVRMATWMQMRDAAIAAYMSDDDTSKRPAGPLTIRAG